MLGGKDGYLALGIAIGFMGALAAFLWFDGFASFGYCDGVCLRDWVGALSGWAAAIGALIAAAWTVPYLKGQLKEARRQSDFLVGDAEPEFVLQRNRAEGKVTLAVYNWNRRRVMIEKVQTADLSAIEVINMVAHEEETENRYRPVSDFFRRRRIPAFGINGWRNRGKKPPSRSFLVIFAHDGAPIEDATGESSINLIVRYRIVGQIHSRRTTAVSALEIEH